MRPPYVKDAFHAYLIAGHGEAVNPAKVGTKAAAHYVLDVPGGGSQTVRLRLAGLPVRACYLCVKESDAGSILEVPDG
jgi:hypothetical protein